MREIKIYKLEELSEDARKKAISDYREDKKESGDWDSEAIHWALDDCALFEPPDAEMEELFGEDYYEKNGKQFLFKNTRGRVHANWDPYDQCIEISDSLEITNDSMFMTWLGFPESFAKRLNPYEITDIRNWTEIELETEIQSENILYEIINIHIKDAKKKFRSHIECILERIEGSFDAYFEDENIESRMEHLDFLEDGTLFKI